MNKIIHKYYDKENGGKEHHSIIINRNEGITQLIESCDDRFIRIWNFHLRKLIKKIYCNDYLNYIYLWDNQYGFVWCDNKIIKLVNLKKGQVIKDLSSHNNYALLLKNKLS